MAFSLLGKRALVTGGSGTIGQAIAKILVQHGASVVLTARNADRLEKAAASIERAVAAAEKTNAAAANASGASSRIQCIPCDVSVESSVVSLFEAIDRSNQHGIDLLVNNAGTNMPGATVGLSAADFERVLRVNVTGPFLCSREAMKRMRVVGDDDDAGDSGGKPLGGRIINIGSLSAHSPRPDSAPYTASKFALAGLTRSLALDGRPHGIVVGILQPGNVASDLLSEDVIRERRDSEGFMEAERVAECVLAMCSMPPTANVLEMTVLPTRQPYVGRG